MKRSGLLALCSALILSAPVLAQEQPPPPEGAATQKMGIAISASQGEGGEMQIMSFSSDDGVGNVFSAPMMIGGEGMLLPGMMDQFGLLSQDSIQEELDFVGEQRDQYKKLQQDYNSRIREKMESMNKGGFDPEKAKNFGEEIRVLKEQQARDIEDLLLPHQINRLKQIQLQQRMKAMGLNALNDKKLAEELGMTEEQLEKLKERAKELSSELQKKIQELREETQQTLLKELSKDQREKLQEMTGSKFDMPAPKPLEMRRPRGSESSRENDR
jgi:DNA-binding Xre family transcriptional regulator